MLSAGIVGLPNVGKSTLFNAVTSTRKAEAENYPFCTIHPNLGVVTVPDGRLAPLAELSKSEKCVPTTIEFVDIAGLVKGASHGEGLGNQFLSHIREVDAIVQVVRCFDDPDVHHVSGTIDPVNDIEVVNTELILADIASLNRRQERLQKLARTGDQPARAELALAEQLLAGLDEGKPINTQELSEEEQQMAEGFFLLSSRPTIFACNILEDDLAAAHRVVEGDGAAKEAAGCTGARYVRAVREYARDHLGTETVVISAQMESEFAELTEEERQEYLAAVGVPDSGSGDLIHAVYHLLGLRTFLTTNENETHAWAIQAGKKALKAAGTVHTDFERGFIAAEVIPFTELMEIGSFQGAREAGKLRIEGKDYEVQDGDVILFRFNV